MGYISISSALCGENDTMCHEALYGVMWCRTLPAYLTCLIMMVPCSSIWCHAALIGSGSGVNAIYVQCSVLFEGRTC